MKGLTAEEYQLLLRSVGTHRNTRPLSPLEVAELLQKATKAGMTRSECAQELSIGTSQVAAFLNLLGLTPQVQHLADWKGSKAASVAFSTMSELRRLDSLDQVAAANAVLLHKLTWNEVVQLVQIALRSSKEIEQCISEVLDLRPRIVIRHLFVGAVKAIQTHRWLKAMSQGERDHLLSGAVLRLTGSDYSASVRLGINEFTIISEHDLSRLLQMKPDEIEDYISQALEAASV